MKLKLAICLAFLLQSFISVSQNAKELYYDFEVGVIEHLEEYIPEDIMITNEADQLVNLKKQIDKPTALIFVYYRCPGICSPLMDGLAEVIEKSDLELSEDYQVLTISFDPTETIDLVIKKKNNNSVLNS